MSGYMSAIAPCFACSRPFSFNVDLVPSYRHEGVRQPICRDCVERVNPQRIANGLDPIVIAPGAYQAQEV